MEFLVQLLLEFLIQVIGEALLELGLHSMAEPFRKPPKPWLAAVGYAIFGALFGAISIWIFPHHMVASPSLRWVNLLATPLAVGLCMACLGAWRSSRGQSVLRIDRFSYGYLFALCFAAIRLVWAV